LEKNAKVQNGRSIFGLKVINCNRLKLVK